MRSVIYILFISTMFACNPSQPKVEVVETTTNTVDSTNIKGTKLFIAATSAYIKEFLKDKPDTLFLSRNPEFPNITLPNIIEQIPIRVINTEEGHATAKRRTMTILNVVDLGKNEVMVVTFKDGFNPQFNCLMYFTYHITEFKLDSLKTEYPYTKEKTRSH
jgi:hypothetical protein